MAASDNGGQRFELHISAVVAESVRKLFRQAADAGKGKTVLTAYRRIVERLEADAADFGEPLYHLPNLRLELRHAVVGLLAVDYAVSLARYQVYIKGFHLL